MPSSKLVDSQELGSIFVATGSTTLFEDKNFGMLLVEVVI